MDNSVLKKKKLQVNKMKKKLIVASHIAYDFLHRHALHKKQTSYSIFLINATEKKSLSLFFYFLFFCKTKTEL